MTVSVHLSDCVAWLVDYAAAHVRDPAAHPLFDSCATDPPYHLTSIVRRFGGDGAAPAKKGRAANATGAYARASKGFMGKTWDGGDVAFRPETWRAVYDVLKPGAHLVAFSGTRTYHRMACAIEDAGFEIRDCLFWAYGSGFPKSHDVSKGIDRAAGAERVVVGRNPNHRAESGVDYAAIYAGGNTGAAKITAPATAEAEQWQGWGTALKPALDPFAGSGTTGLAAMAEGFDATLIEMEADHVADINRKLAWARGDGALSMIEHLRRDVAAAGGAELSGGLFDFDWAGMPENGEAA